MKKGSVVRLSQFNENATCGFRVDKGDALAARTEPWLLINHHNTV
jgi:hypothetical protein